jgi:hypothetical protein
VISRDGEGSEERADPEGEAADGRAVEDRGEPGPGGLMYRAAGRGSEGEELKVETALGEGVDLAEKEGLREEGEAAEDVQDRPTPARGAA